MLDWISCEGAWSCETAVQQREKSVYLDTEEDDPVNLSLGSEENDTSPCEEKTVVDVNWIWTHSEIKLELVREIKLCENIKIGVFINIDLSGEISERRVRFKHWEF